MHDLTADERRREQKREAQRRYRATPKGQEARRRERQRARHGIRIVPLTLDDAGWRARGDSLSLTYEHAWVLQRRAVSADVAEQRGYRSVMDWGDAESLGHLQAESTASIPAIDIPVYDIHGKLQFHQLRPDKPRYVKSRGMTRAKPAKYPAPKGSVPVLDVHPQVREQVRASDEELFLVEGVIKADSAVSHGLLAIGLTAGVWGWKSGTPLDDWKSVQLKGRRILIVFDTDIRTNPGVRRAAHSLEDMLRERGARPFILDIPREEEGFGIDDFFATGGSRKQLRAVETHTDAKVAARTLLVQNTSAARGRHARPSCFTPAQLQVGLYLIEQMRSFGVCHVPVDTMAEELRLSTKTVHEAVEALKELRVGPSHEPVFIRHKGQDWASRPPGHRPVNGYALNLNALARVMNSNGGELC